MSTQNRSFVVSLIGRPNVGKSSIFNRILRRGNVAMTHDLPGVTRDRHYSIATIDALANEPAQDLILVDTGGFYPEKVDIDETMLRKNNYEPFFNLMADHAKMAIGESDLVLFVVDVREGMLPFDKMICDYLRIVNKPFWLLINKFDTEKQAGEEADFYSLAIDEENFFLISAEHARGMENLRERLQLASIEFQKKENDQKEVQKGVTPIHDVVANIAIIGAPNVGKSTLLNKLVGAERALVSNIAGTTVDPIYAYFSLYFGDDAKNLEPLDDPFRRDNLSFMEQYKNFLVAKDDIKSNMIDYDEKTDYEDEEEDLLMFEKYQDQVDLDEVEPLISDEEAYQNVFNEKLNAADSNNESSELDFSNFEDLDIETLKFADDEPETQIEQEEFVQTTTEEIIPWRSVKIVDTAGIRKAKNVKGFLETQSVYRSLRSISEADIVIYMVDATQGIQHQDRRLIDISLEKGKSVIVCLNKMDLMSKTLPDDKAKMEWLKDMRARIPWLNYCEILTISARYGTQMRRLRESLKATVLIRQKKIATSQLNSCVTDLMNRNPVMLENSGGVRLKVKYAAMVKTSPPTVLLFSNRSKGISESYRRYLTSGIRNNFKLINTPVHLIFRTRGEIERRMHKVGGKAASDERAGKSTK
jgi:GTP-binding protein